ncbi:MAG TPA: M3 family metallopeptidase [Tetrasphaera sp.]|uniref:M3 family metallopeptidase n=1 Tax=Nostocoides sp. TaxID=1917966 RepID=UPI002CC62A0C|nr:M3 family metallopeptidase [Tetrasphaera sp.]HNQ07357.1 M3 family metallopeptidase [Tetrasphaera sp.]
MSIEPESLPADPAAWEPYVRERVGASLATARLIVERLKDGTPRTTAETLALWNDGDIAIAHASGAAGLFAQVHPDLGVRTAAEDGTVEIERFLTGRALDRELFDVLAALDTHGLDADAERVLRHTLRDFRRAGVDRDEATRARLAAISERLTELGQDFGRAIRDDVRSIRVAPDRLAGLPQDFIDAHPVDAEGLVTITTDYPDVIPFRTFAHDRAARQELVSAFNNRAWPQNDAVLHEILDLRAELAGLLDYPNWPDYDAEVKMIGSGGAIGAFIDRIAGLAHAPAQRELALLLERAQRDDAAIESITSADSAYVLELVRRERFDVDAAAVRGYFDFAAVRAGLLDVTGRLFGITYAERPDAPVWHPDVTAYDVLRDQAPIGRIYLDLHPREGKFKHAAQFDLVSGVSSRNLPEGALVCNFSRGLMEHQDVVTLFHEFGHLIHHVLSGDQQWVRFSGVATEWDFVEAPSQLLEQWAWDAGVLATFARDGEGTPIPADLVARMVEAHEFGKGLQARTQMFYAATSYYLHLERPADHTARVAELQRTYDAYARLPDTHFQASFGHLDGYGSGYYTYMWSLVIAKDLFTAFDPAALFDTRVAGRYRDHVLAPGGSRDAADLVAAFLGRPYSFDAFGAWLAG